MQAGYKSSILYLQKHTSDQVLFTFKNATAYFDATLFPVEVDTISIKKGTVRRMQQI